MGQKDESAEFMLTDKTQFLQANGNDYSSYESQQQQMPRVTSPTAFLASEAGIDSPKLQLMKASFFGDDDQELDNNSIGASAEHNYDYNRSQNRRAGLFNKNIPNVHASSQSLLKESSYGDNISEVSSQFDFVIQPSSLPPSSATSVMSIIREVDTETSTPALNTDMGSCSATEVTKNSRIF